MVSIDKYVCEFNDKLTDYDLFLNKKVNMLQYIPVDLVSYTSLSLFSRHQLPAIAGSLSSVLSRCLVNKIITDTHGAEFKKSNGYHRLHP